MHSHIIILIIVIVQQTSQMLLTKTLWYAFKKLSLIKLNHTCTHIYVHIKELKQTYTVLVSIAEQKEHLFF